MPQGAEINNLESFSDDFFAFGNSNIVFKYSNNKWDTIIYQPNELLRNFKVSNMELITCTESYATIYNQNLDTLDFLYAYNGNTEIAPNDIIYSSGYYWIADNSKGFTRVKNNFSSEKIDKEDLLIMNVFICHLKVKIYMLLLEHQTGLIGIKLLIGTVFSNLIVPGVITIRLIFR